MESIGDQRTRVADISATPRILLLAVSTTVSGRFAAILFLVCNHLGDLLGTGSAKWLLRISLLYPNVCGVPKWFAMLPRLDAHPRTCIAQVIPITWRNRRVGESKLKIKEMGSRYLFAALYCRLEKYFSRGDYRTI